MSLDLWLFGVLGFAKFGMSLSAVSMVCTCGGVVRILCWSRLRSNFMLFGITMALDRLDIPPSLPSLPPLPTWSRPFWCGLICFLTTYPSIVLWLGPLWPPTALTVRWLGFGDFFNTGCCTGGWLLDLALGSSDTVLLTLLETSFCGVFFPWARWLALGAGTSYVLRVDLEILG